MLTLTEQSILYELDRGPLNHYELAEILNAAPFTIRAELKALRRRKLVFERTDGYWDLGAAGLELVDTLQLRLEI